MRSFVGETVKFLTLVFIFCVFSLAADAQTKRKPKPLATPPPVLSGAEIISQAGDYEQPTVVTTLPAQKTVEKAPVKGARVNDLSDRVKKLESAPKNDYDEKQKRMVLNLDILTRAEQRSESLRKQLFELVDKENTIKTRIDQIENDSRPEMIERTLQLAGSMKPEEVRDMRRKSLLSEKANLEALLSQIQGTRTNLAITLDKSDIMVEKLRTKLEKDIDDSFLKDDPQN